MCYLQLVIFGDWAIDLDRGCAPVSRSKNEVALIRGGHFKPIEGNRYKRDTLAANHLLTLEPYVDFLLYASSWENVVGAHGGCHLGSSCCC